MADSQLDRLQNALVDRYALQHEIGRGGWSVVYKAHDLRLKRDVAIKVLRSDVASAIGSDRFLREIEIASVLQHPNVLPLFDSGEADGMVYYVMPFIEGESLAQRLERDQQLSVEESLNIARDVASALSYAHKHGVVHRDIKPENILLSGGRAVVADFGIARAVTVAGGDRLTATGVAVGTPAYMSPEQAGDQAQLDGRSDIYSLGCVLFEMLAGEPPFTGRTAQAIIARHMQERLPSLEVIRPGAPLHVVAAIETALAKVPADRFETADDFVEALDLEKAIKSGRVLGRAPRKRWLRVALPGLAMAVALVVWLVAGTERVPLDPNKVVVFPLEERNVAAEHSGSGYDVALMVGVALEHADPLRTVDGRRRLDPEQRGDISLVSVDVKRSISRDRRAAYYMDGVVRLTGDSATVVLVLHDAAGDSVVRQESSTRSRQEGSLVDVGFYAVIELLPALLDPDREVDLTHLIGRNPGAVALWIQGERRYRESDFAAALDLYQRAVAEDSLLAFAAIKGAQAASWVRDHDRADQLLQVALAKDTLLPDRYRSFAYGLNYYDEGQADSAVGRFTEVLEEYPEWSEAWAALGEVYRHLIPTAHSLDSLAEDAFSRAVQYDLAFTPPLMHLAERALRKGMVDSAEGLIARLRNARADTTVLRHLELIRACVTAGSAAIDWMEFARTNLEAVVTSSKNMAVGGVNTACAMEGFKAILATENPYRWGALLALHNTLIMTGNAAEARALLDSAYAAGETAPLWLYVLDPLAGAGLESKAQEVATLSQGWFGENYERGSPALRWLLGVWHAQSGEVDKASIVATALDSIAGATGNSQDRLYADAVAAHLALARHDTVQAITRLSSLRPVATRPVLSWGVTESLAVEFFKLAELLEATGQFEEAWHIAALFYHDQPVMYLPYVAKSLDLRLRVAEALGRRGWIELIEGRLARLDAQRHIDAD